MTSLHYQPATSGGLIAIAFAPRLLLLPAETDDAFLETAWTTLAEPAGFQAVLELLTRGGLAAMPSFLLLEHADENQQLRVIVRGELTIAVTDAAGESSLSGLGVSTWTERVFTGVTDAALTVAGAKPTAQRALPLIAGVATVAGVALGSSATSVPAAVAAPVLPSGTPARAKAAPAAAAAPSAIDHAAISEATVVAPSAEAPGEPEGAVTENPDAEKHGPDKHGPDTHGTEKQRTDKPGTAEPDTDAVAGYDYLFGDTMYRSVADAAVTPHVEDEAAEAAPGTVADADGDHDGHTVLTSDIAKLRAGRKSKRGSSAPPAAPAAPKLVLELSTGGREPLTQPILVGRAPSVSKVSGGQLPRLVVMGGVDQDISRNHAQFVLEGDTVVVTDLHSRNGTRIILPGKSPQTLRAGEPTSVIVGTVVDLGGGITLTIGED